MDGTLVSWTRPVRQAAWSQRRVAVRLGAVVAMLVAVAGFGAIMVLDTVVVRAGPSVAVMLTSAGGG